MSLYWNRSRVSIILNDGVAVLSELGPVHQAKHQVRTGGTWPHSALIASIATEIRCQRFEQDSARGLLLLQWSRCNVSGNEDREGFLKAEGV